MTRPLLLTLPALLLTTVTLVLRDGVRLGDLVTALDAPARVTRTRAVMRIEWNDGARIVASRRGGWWAQVHYVTWSGQ